MTPHVLYVHMTYVYSFSYVSHFTRSHDQKKSLSYYDLLYDFGVLFYGRTPTLIFYFFLYHTTPILTIDIYQRWTYLQQDMTRTACMEKRKTTQVFRRTLF